MSQPIGRNLVDGELVLTGKSLVSFDREGQLIVVDREKGTIVGRLALDGLPQRGLRAQGNRVLVPLRRPKVRNVAMHDAVQAVQIEPLTLLWEFADEGLAPGLPGCDDFAVAVPSTSGEVVLFR